jgi:hypothetical protein
MYFNLLDVCKVIRDWTENSYCEQKLYRDTVRRLESLGLESTHKVESFLASAELTEIIDILHPLDVYRLFLEIATESITRQHNSIHSGQRRQQQQQVEKIYLHDTEDINFMKIYLSPNAEFAYKYSAGDTLKCELRRIVQKDMLGFEGPHSVVGRIEDAYLQLKRFTSHERSRLGDFREMEKLIQYINKKLEDLLKSLMCFYLSFKIDLLKQQTKITLPDKCDSWNWYAIETYIIKDIDECDLSTYNNLKIIQDIVKNFSDLRKLRNVSVHSRLREDQLRQYVKNLGNLLEKLKEYRLVSGYVSSVTLRYGLTEVSIKLDGQQDEIRIYYKDVEKHTVYSRNQLISAVGLHRIMVFPLVSPLSGEAQPYMVHYSIFNNNLPRRRTPEDKDKRTYEYRQLCLIRKFLFFRRVPIECEMSSFTPIPQSTIQE